jgi:hypothetical protein
MSHLWDALRAQCTEFPIKSLILGQYLFWQEEGIEALRTEKGMSKLKAAKAMLSMCHRSCSPAPTR